MKSNEWHVYLIVYGHVLIDFERTEQKRDIFFLTFSKTFIKHKTCTNFGIPFPALPILLDGLFLILNGN